MGMEGDSSWLLEGAAQPWTSAAQTATRRILCFMVHSVSLMNTGVILRGQDKRAAKPASVRGITEC